MAENFVAAHHQVGGFEVINVNGNIKKTGGNVAAYFCTPCGRVINAVAGPVSAEQLLEQARWAIEQYAQVRELTLHRRAQQLAQSHQLAMAELAGTPSSNLPVDLARQRKIHGLLSTTGLPPLATVYGYVFSSILGERLRDQPSELALADRLLTMAQRQGRPLLFVFHRGRCNASGMHEWLGFLADARREGLPLRPLLQDYVVIVLPLQDAPALSRRLEREPFEFDGSASPLFAICHSDGQQVGSAAGRKQARQLAQYLAAGWVDAIRSRPPPPARIRQVARFLERLDERLARQLRQFMVARRLDDPSVSDARLLADATRHPYVRGAEAFDAAR